MSLGVFVHVFLYYVCINCFIFFQILVSGQHPMSVSPCCPASGPPTDVAGGGGGGGSGESRLLSPFPRLATAGFGLYGYAEHPLSTLAGTATSAFYPSLVSN